MASKGVTFQNDKETLSRFVYDVIVYSALKFGVADNCIIRYPGKENDYSEPNFIPVLSRLIFKYQITQRFNWGLIFFVRHFAKEIRTDQDIRDILKIVIELSKEESPDCVLEEIIVSLAIVNELIVYLYAIEASSLCILQLIKVWIGYYSSVKESFENAGGFIELYNRFSKSDHSALDVFYGKFIPQFCVPYYSKALPALYYHFYNTINIHEHMERIASRASDDRDVCGFCASFYRPTKFMMGTTEILRISLISELVYLDLFNAHFNEVKNAVLVHHYLNYRYLRLGPGSTTSYRIEYNDPTPLVLPSLDIGASTSIEDDPHPTLQDIEVSIGLPTQEEQETESSSHPSIEDLQPANLGPPEAKRSKESESMCRESTSQLFNVGASTSTHKIPDTSLQEMAVACKGLSTQMGATSSPHLSAEDLEQVNFDSTKIKQRTSSCFHLQIEKFKDFSSAPITATERFQLAFKRWLLKDWYIQNDIVLMMLDPKASNCSEFDLNLNLQQELEKLRESANMDSCFRQSIPGPSEAKNVNEPEDGSVAMGSKNSTAKNELGEKFLADCERFMHHLMRNYVGTEIEGVLSAALFRKWLNSHPGPSSMMATSEESPEEKPKTEESTEEKPKTEESTEEKPKTEESTEEKPQNEKSSNQKSKNEKSSKLFRI